MTAPGRGDSPKVPAGLEALRLLRVDEVAALLRVSARQVRAWRSAGVLHSVDLGGARLVRFRVEDVQRFVEGSA